MLTIKMVLESKVDIRFQSCNLFNHLNNSRYINYIITARGDLLLKRYGLASTTWCAKKT